MPTRKTDGKKLEKEILNHFLEYVLDKGQLPVTVYQFCKESGFKEKDFYRYYGSIQGIQSAVWDSFYDNTYELLAKNKDYNSYGNKDKMLSFFYTFFELLTLNRSYVLFSIQSGGLSEKASQWRSLRKKIKNFSRELIEDGNDQKSRLGHRNPAIFSEGAWWHFLFILKFWADDNSPGFEKTDMAIEKSINTIFDLFETTPLDSMVDFGKFLYQEKFA